MRIPFFFLSLLLLSSTLSAQVPADLSHKIGQMIMIGLPGKEVDTASLFFRDIRDGKIGGVTLYERHLTDSNSAENLRGLIASLQKAAPLPLLVSVTQEGGQVTRLKPKYGFPALPSAFYLGTLDNPDSTKWYADNMAYTLSRLGINLNFAPVVDVHRPDNPIIGSRERAYAADAEVITRQAAQVIASHRYFGVTSALKHFPGHGSSLQDSHLGLTDVTSTWEKRELEPYRRLIRSGLVKAVMTAHIVNEALDKSRLPATLSRKIITGLLRERLKFRGVVISDDMHMKAISSEYGLKEALALALNAGVDVLLFSGNTAEVASGSGLVDLIGQLVEEKKVSSQTIEAAYRRIMALKGLSPQP